jgi:hypothetical protein
MRDYILPGLPDKNLHFDLANSTVSLHDSGLALAQG